MSNQQRRSSVYRGGRIDHSSTRFAPPEAPRTSWMAEQYKEFVAAVRFISILPVPGSAELFASDDEHARPVLGAAYFSLVGVILGVVLWLLNLLLGPYVPPLALSAITVVVLVILTGALHLDGLMDTFDGLLGGATRESKLEIMRDSRVGSFGAIAGFSVLLLKFAFVASLNAHLIAVIFLIVLPVSRWAMVLAVSVFPNARPSGLGAAFRHTVTTQRLLFVGALALIVAVLVGQLMGVILWLGGSLFALGLGFWMTYVLGGLTGDSYGTLVELNEVLLLLLVLLLHF